MNMFASQSMHQGQHENLTYHTKFPKCVTAHPLPFPGNFLIRMFPRSGRPTGRPIGQEHTRNFNPSGRNTVVLVILVIMGLSNVYLYLGPTHSRRGIFTTDSSVNDGFSEANEHKLSARHPRSRPQLVDDPIVKEDTPSLAYPYAGRGNPFSSHKTRDRTKRKNVLFIMTDDLRPSLSIYNKPVITPGFERLAKGGVVFERNYNQDPICNPSRNSLLSGRRPDTTKVWLFEDTVASDYGNIFRYFKKEGGYKMLGTGKLWHWTSSFIEEFDNKYFPKSTDAWNDGTDENYQMMNASVQPDDNWPEERFWDYRIASEGISLMREAVNTKDGNPFFLGVGFHQPHRPWHMPQKYWDLYEDRYVPVTPHTTWPIDAPGVATGDINPLEIGMLPDSEKTYVADPTGRVPSDAIRENVRGYHASISFLDHQIQRLLDELERLSLVEDTIIVFCADHGMNIGDHGMWDKRTLFETNARVPLIIRDPDIPESFGMNASALAENVDIFPTMIEMAGLPDPAGRLFPPLEGKSLVPVLRDPVNGRVKDFALTQIPRCCSQGCGNRPLKKVPWFAWEVCSGGNRDWNDLNERVYMGYSMRTDEWRYTAWVPFNASTHTPEWTQAWGGEELYDHRDPRCNEKGNFDSCETRNMAKDVSLQLVKKELYAKMRSIVDTYNYKQWKLKSQHQSAKKVAEQRLRLQ
ncbi:iduronate-2-sulfatase [Nannochloropsis gaditana]|uniref:Iduronate-2-sulfatase n=1 Tax=Nannochloropsis gaditana TaxID=72520 RepID=W7U650_9STRA|nr:iduronate-2-sulfatase [Nannochloropsis gaditana]